MWHRSRFYLALLVLFLLSSCTQENTASHLLDNYLTRLARVLDHEKPHITPSLVPHMPAAAQLQQDAAPVKIDLLDYWAFRECGLTLILSERNSVLGRVMLPSQLLHMDGRILRQLSYCEQQLKNPELVLLTQQLLADKRAQWPVRYWNATVAAPELRRFWSSATTPLEPGEEATYTPAEAALNELQRLPQKLETSTAWPDIKVLESHYQQLDAYALGGKLLHSLQLAHDYLLAANQLLASATDQKTLCPRGHALKELDYARNVMSNYFVGEVQPWLAAINQRASLLLPRYHALVAQQDSQLQPLILPFQQQVTQLHQDFIKQNRAHVAHWKALFDACGSRAVAP